jgi:hypothetical protein
MSWRWSSSERRVFVTNEDRVSRSSFSGLSEHASFAVKKLDGLTIGAHHAAEARDVDREESHAHDRTYSLPTRSDADWW